MVVVGSAVVEVVVGWAADVVVVCSSEVVVLDVVSAAGVVVVAATVLPLPVASLPCLAIKSLPYLPSMAASMMKPWVTEVADSAATSSFNILVECILWEWWDLLRGLAMAENYLPPDGGTVDEVLSTVTWPTPWHREVTSKVLMRPEIESLTRALSREALINRRSRPRVGDGTRISLRMRC